MHIQTPFSVFVKKLQESLTRMEPYEVVTIAQGVDGSLDPGAYLLAPLTYRNRFQEKFSVAACSSTQAPVDRHRRFRCPESSE